MPVEIDADHEHGARVPAAGELLGDEHAVSVTCRPGVARRRTVSTGSRKTRAANSCPLGQIQARHLRMRVNLQHLQRLAGGIGIVERHRGGGVFEHDPRLRHEVGLHVGAETIEVPRHERDRGQQQHARS